MTGKTRYKAPPLDVELGNGYVWFIKKNRTPFCCLPGQKLQEDANNLLSKLLKKSLRIV